ncbi:MAG: GAP family protein [Coriobacteriia bacterium]|nr:GAP family protein [Coriobacteriia bacterium]
MNSSELGRVVAAMLPFALAGVFVPSWTKYVIILLGSGRPLANASAFILGNAAFRFFLGVAVLLSFRINVVQDTTTNPPGGAHWYLVAIGLLLVGIGFYLIRKRPQDRDELPGWLRALERIKPWAAFVAGLAMMAAPGVQYVYFLGGMGVAVNSSLDSLTQFLLLLAFIAFLELMLLSPIVVFALGGGRSTAMMQSFKQWLGRNEFKVFGAIIGAFGLFLLYASF